MPSVPLVRFRTPLSDMTGVVSVLIVGVFVLIPL